MPLFGVTSGVAAQQAHGGSGTPASFRASATASYASGGNNTLTINKPTGTSEDDFMLAWIMHGTAGDQTPNTPSGWTFLSFLDGGGGSAYCWTKVAGASEGSSYSFDGWTDNNDAAGLIVTYQDGATTSPIDTSARTIGSSPKSTTITTGTDSCLVIVTGGGDYAGSNSFSESGGSGLTERVDQHFSVASDICIYAYDEELGTAGQYTRTIADGNSSSLHNWMLALKPG